jgi:hypothetical protein
MTTYIIKDFSFNIGGTNLSQSYVELFNPGIPWGINTTYIYKDSVLNPQFSNNNIINQHLVIENKTNNGNIIFKTQETGTGKIIINDLSVNLINGQPYTGSGGGSLTINSVNSSHIQDGSILGSDISNNTITYDKLIPFGIIRIINQSANDTDFAYVLSVYNTINNEYDSLAVGNKLKQYNSFSHFYQTPFNVNMKLVVDSEGGIRVESFNLIQGVEQVSEDGNMLIFKIDSSSKYQNIEIGVNVYF